MQYDQGKHCVFYHRYPLPGRACLYAREGYRLVHEVSPQGVAWRRSPKDSGDHSASLRRKWRRDRSRRSVERSCPHVRIGAAKARHQRPCKKDEGTFIVKGAAGVYRC